MKKFWEVIFDDANKKMEVIGVSFDDTQFNYHVSEMRGVGMQVHNATPSINIREEDIVLNGYSTEKGLYKRLLNEYEMKVGKRLKW